ncbi:MAG TPA: PP2C family serine/threonine-protein phosphatase [Blastocatellia bacterium]|nr:PP2C family serine/threonine-protein phosphatase [Blastocatellia bacterium]
MSASSRQGEEREADELAQPDAPDGSTLESFSSALVEVDLAAASQAGTARADNTDHYIAVRMERSLLGVLSNLPADTLPHSFDETAYGMAVADGMSAMSGAALASTAALRKLVELVVNTPDWIMRLNRRKAAAVKRRLVERFGQIDLALKERSEKDPRMAGISSTLTVACSLGSDLFVAHIGDTRAYLMRGGLLHQVTSDHTMAQAMIDAGVAGAGDAVVRGTRRVLTAALGSALPSNPEVQRLRLRHGDQVLLCTDGLTEGADFETIGSILRKGGSADEACRDLIEAALRGGSNDNITVVLARYRFPQTDSPNRSVDATQPAAQNV